MYQFHVLNIANTKKAVEHHICSWEKVIVYLNEAFDPEKKMMSGPTGDLVCLLLYVLPL